MLIQVLLLIVSLIPAVLIFFYLMGGVFEITIDGDLFKASVMLDKA